MNKHFVIATLAGVSVFLATGSASAQIAGASTSIAVSVIESTELAMGWSAKQSILGKSLYNEGGVEVGKVVDLIVAPSKSVSYLIVSAGGFVGVGRFDVAIPVAQVQRQGATLVMTGATKESIKALPHFEYADSIAKRDAFYATADAEVLKAKAALSKLKAKAFAATGAAKTELDEQINELQPALLAAEASLGKMKRAAASRWKEFEADVSQANTRLRKSLESLVS